MMSLNDSDKNLLFLAILPPEPLKTAQSELKRNISENWGGRAALKSPPHITLFPPFVFPQKKMELLDSKIKDIISKFNSFSINLSGFDRFRDDVLFIKVGMSEDLKKIHESILKSMLLDFKIPMERYGGRAYHPHITLAFRDIPKKNFSGLWKEFSNRTYHNEFVCTSITLLKHNGKYWEEYQSFPLN